MVSLPQQLKEQVNLAHKQDLGKVLPKRKPIVPETVSLGPEVQHFQSALDSLHLPTLHPHPPPEQVPRQTPLDVPEEDQAPDRRSQLWRSNRLDFQRFHTSGDRFSKSKE